MPVNYAFASEFSYEVLERRRRFSELGPQVLDSTNQRLMPLPSTVAQFDSFIADRESALEDSRLIARRER